MNPCVAPAVALALAINLGATPLHALQATFDLPTYTDLQRWDRAATESIAIRIGEITLAKAHGMTAADAGRASASVFGPGWIGANTPFLLFRGMYRNLMSHPQQTCALIEASDTIVRGQCNRPWVTYFGPSGQVYGVTVAEYEQQRLAFMSAIADQLGMDLDQRIDGDSLLITLRKR